MPVGPRRVLPSSHGYAQSSRKVRPLRAQETPTERPRLTPGLFCSGFHFFHGEVAPALVASSDALLNGRRGSHPAPSQKCRTWSPAAGSIHCLQTAPQGLPPPNTATSPRPPRLPGAPSVTDPGTQGPRSRLCCDLGDSEGPSQLQSLCHSPMSPSA